MAIQLSRAQRDNLNYLTSLLDEYLLMSNPKAYEKLLANNGCPKKNDFAVVHIFEDILKPFNDFRIVTQPQTEQLELLVVFLMDEIEEKERRLSNGTGNKHIARELALLNVIGFAFHKYIFHENDSCSAQLN